MHALEGTKKKIECQYQLRKIPKNKLVAFEGRPPKMNMLSTGCFSCTVFLAKGLVRFCVA
jgi:hypothetical protein